MFVIVNSMTDYCTKRLRLCNKKRIFCSNICVFERKFVPLHPTFELKALPAAHFRQDLRLWQVAQRYKRKL